MPPQGQSRFVEVEVPYMPPRAIRLGASIEPDSLPDLPYRRTLLPMQSG